MLQRHTMLPALWLVIVVASGSVFAQSPGPDAPWRPPDGRPLLLVSFGSIVIAIIMAVITFWLLRRRSQLENRTQELEAKNRALLAEIGEHQRDAAAQFESEINGRIQADEALIEERELQQQRDFAVKIMDTLGQGVSVTNAEGRYEFVNPAYARMVGRPLNKILGQRPSDLVYHEDLALLVEARRHRQNGEVTSYEARFQRPDGSIVNTLITAAPRWQDNRVVGAISVTTDLTQHKRTEDALRASEERFRSLIQTAGSVILVLGTDFSILEFNREAERIYGFRREEVLGKNYLEFFIPEEFRDAIIADVQKVLGGEPTRGFENPVRGRGGQEYILLWNVIRLLDSNDHPIGIIAAGQDITERKQSEAAEREQRILAEALRDSAAVLTSTLELDEVLDRILTQIARVVPHDASTIAMIDGDMQCIVRHRGYMERGLEEFMSGLCFPVHNTKSQRIIETGLPLVISDVRNHSDWMPMKETNWIRSYLGAPIQVEGHVIGFINVDSAMPGAFTPIHAEHLQAFAHQASIAIQNARHASELQQRAAAEHEQRILSDALRETAAVLNSTLELSAVLDRVLTYVAQVVPHDAATIMLVEVDQIRVIRHRGYTEHGITPHQLNDIRLSLDKTLVLRRLMETGAPLAIDDVRAFPGWQVVPETAWIRSFVGAPIQFGGGTIGFLNLDSATPGAFTPVHAERLQAFAHQASIAIRNAQHTTELEQQVIERTTELEFERRQLQAIFDATGEGVLYNEDGSIRYINRALAMMTGYSAEDLIGQATDLLRAQPLTTEDSKRAQMAQQVIASGNIWREEITLRRKDGSEFDAALTVSLVGEPNIKPIRMVAVIRDISREKQLEAQKARFIAKAAHDLRNPVTSVDIRLYRMKQSPDNLSEHIPLMELAVNHLKHLVEDLLDLSTFENGVFVLRRQIVIAQMLLMNVLEMYQPLAERKLITFEATLPPMPVPIFIDGERMMQVLTNLVVNAINYTPEEGRVEIGVKTVADTNTATTYAVIYVHDNGVGIMPEDLPFIFQPFFRVAKDNRGTGLGLSIAKEIVELHGGQIMVESKVGEGSCFSIKLPLLNGET
jgi:PAS domain S-box-containing protein